MEATQQELYLLNKRDDEEKDRLNQQNVIVRAVRNGHVLDPVIPKQSISRIADIATGTGIWMEDVRTEFAAAGIRSPLEMVGFDISPVQFPKSSLHGTKFIVWDMNDSFPEAYHNSFDVVHIRFVDLALVVDQIKGVVENLVKLLKPGGYLQWTDITYFHGRESVYPGGAEGLSCKAEGEMMFAFHHEQKYSHHMTGDVEKALRSLPMEDPHVTDYTDVPHRTPSTRKLVADWHAQSVPLVIKMAMLRKGVSKEETKKTTDAYREKVIEMARNGTVFQMTMMTLVSRKKVNV